MESGDIIQNNEPKPKLSNLNVSGVDLKKHFILVFGTYQKAAVVAGVTDSRIHQILAGYDVPQNADLIKKFANAWNVDVVVLTQLFDKLRRGILE
jgi:hypothetical protein